MPTVLIIDDNAGVRTALEVLFSLHDIDAVSAASPRQGIEALGAKDVDLVIQDMNFTADTTSGEEGIALFHELRRRQPDLPVILLTAWTHLETAVELVKAGAADYLEKPWDDNKLLTTARNLLDLRAATRARRDRRTKLEERFRLCGLVFESDAMADLLSVATQVAHANVPVLITGANGAGKEKLADIVQANSSVRDGPYVKVNVGALPADLMEAELFGAEAGAYTGAKGRRTGRFEAADGGTLFLDEIGNLPHDGQAKLLRVLQTGEFERLGSSRTQHVDVRIVSATNADLKRAIAEGRFREDLYYRLNVIELEVPPLADRPDDVLPLARHFLDDGLELDDSARRVLAGHSWPGNVRELENCIRRASLLSRDRVVRAVDLGLETPAVEAAHSPEPARVDIEQALEAAGGVVAKAARDLGMSRQALYRRMEKHGIAKQTGG